MSALEHQKLSLLRRPVPPPSSCPPSPDILASTTSTAVEVPRGVRPTGKHASVVRSSHHNHDCQAPAIETSSGEGIGEARCPAATTIRDSFVSFAVDYLCPRSSCWPHMWDVSGRGENSWVRSLTKQPNSQSSRNNHEDSVPLKSRAGVEESFELLAADNSKKSAYAISWCWWSPVARSHGARHVWKWSLRRMIVRTRTLPVPRSLLVFGLLLIVLTFGFFCLYTSTEEPSQHPLKLSSWKKASSDVGPTVSSSSLSDNKMVGKTKDVMPHIIFSTDCSPFMTWQSELLLSSARRVGHTGKITRIASGCTEDQQQKERARKRNSPLGIEQDYDVFFAGDYAWDEVSKTKYTPRNKPGGLRDWLQSLPNERDEEVVALIDTDFIFLRPLVTNTGGDHHLTSKNWISASSSMNESVLNDWVAPGYMVSQAYGYGSTWLKGVDKLNSSFPADSPVHGFKPGTARALDLAVGPPYIGLVKDFRALVGDYFDLTGTLWRLNGGWMEEMSAFSLATANQGIQQKRLANYMISHPSGEDEGWPWIDGKLSDDQNPCSEGEGEGLHALFHRHNGRSVAEPPEEPISLPTFFHYCQSLQLEDSERERRTWIWTKYRLPHDQLLSNCSMPLFKEPPASLWTAANSKGDVQGARKALMICTGLKALNAMLKDHRSLSCPGGVFNNEKRAFITKEGRIQFD